MNRRAFLLLLVAALALFGGPARAAAPPKTLHVLFIGNSYTYVNRLPEVLVELLASRGVVLEQESSTIGGATLEKHWAEGRALATIQKRAWDYVVLQEQSTRPFKEREAMFKSMRLFDAEIRKAGAKTLLYETWSTKTTPDDQPKLTDAYETLGRELGATVVPAGEAWKRATAAGLDLYGPDGRHPGPLGAYLTACVFARVLTDGPAAGLLAQVSEKGRPWPHPDAAEAAQLQQCADAVALQPAK